MSSKERPLFRSAMFVAIENDRGEVLLQRRADTGFLDGHWDLSATGHLEYGESMQTCGVREAEEEVGLTVREKDLEVVALFQTAFEPGIRYVNTIFRCRLWQGDPVIGEPTKIAELGWFAPENFPDKLTVGARVYLMSLGNQAARNYYIGPDEYREMMGAGYEGA